MQGTRKPDGTLPHEMEPGDYALANSGDRVWLCSPVGVAGSVDSKWTITIEDDGTISISPSIWWSKHEIPPGWHGYLEHGVWRQV